MVKVELFGPLRALTGLREVVLDLGGRVRLGELLKRLPDEVRRYVLDEGGKPQPGVLILVNGTDVRYLSWLDTDVGEDDVVTLIPSIHGGLYENC